jgi:alkylation response protein AidB-like acyl-CoA dehydrogenase
MLTDAADRCRMTMQKPIYPLTARQADFVARAQLLAAKFRARAAEHDRTGTFPFANYADIRAAHLPGWVVPPEFGGAGANLLETVQICEALGVGDGSTALAVTMHLQTLGGAVEARSWPESILIPICRAAVQRGALVNFISTEPELGSMSRGGKPATTARPVAAHKGRPAGYVLNGRKNFASMSPVLDFLIASAQIDDGSEGVANFVLTPGSGVEVIETWDALGMRSTGSHDVLLTDVFVPAEWMIPPGMPDPESKPKVAAWFSLGVSAVYLGVAEAALQSASRYAQTRIPTALGKPIAELEGIQRRLGHAELLLQQARLELYHAADLWDRLPDRRADLVETVLVAKYTVTNNAVAALDECMRVPGGAAMTHALPLERYYRDVRGGLNHPMHDDEILLTLGRLALARNRPDE